MVLSLTYQISNSVQAARFVLLKYVIMLFIMNPEHAI